MKIEVGRDIYYTFEDFLDCHLSFEDPDVYLVRCSFEFESKILKIQKNFGSRWIEKTYPDLSKEAWQLPRLVNEIADHEFKKGYKNKQAEIRKALGL